MKKKKNTAVNRDYSCRASIMYPTYRNTEKKLLCFLGITRQVSPSLPGTMSTPQCNSLPSTRHRFKGAFTSLIATYRVRLSFHAVSQTLTYSSTIPSEVSLPITPSSVSRWHLSSISVVTVAVSREPPSLFIRVSGRPLRAA